MNTARVVELLRCMYGAPAWEPDGQPLDVLVKTVLSQNTSDVNSHRAFALLKQSFPGWKDVLNADVEKVAFSIRMGGLNRVKAARIKEILYRIKQERGRLELGFLSRLVPQEAEKWLLELPGVGLKTARCVLLFSLGVPVLPVDTHILRVSRRLGLLSAGASAEQAHRVLNGAVLPEDVYHFHILMIEHGRKTCHPRKPDCEDCVLRAICPGYAVFTGKRPVEHNARK